MKHKFFYLLGTCILFIAFMFNMKHSLNNYGFLTNSLMLEIFAQSSSDGDNTSTGGTITDVCASGICSSETISHDWGTGTCNWYVDPRFTNPMPVRSWSSYTVKCIKPTFIIKESTCESGTRITYYHYNSACVEVGSHQEGNAAFFTCDKSK